MKVRVYPCDRSGCGHYRAILPALCLEGEGVMIEGGLYEIGVEQEIEYAGVTTKRRRRTSITCDADVGVFQRVVSQDRVEMLAELRSKGTAIVVDVDDDLDRLPTGHPYHPEATPGHGRNWLHEACKLADLVTVSTPALAERYGSHGRVLVLENCVPQSYIDLRTPGHSNLIGWTGSTMTHVRDLEVCGNGVRKALQDSGAKFYAVGTGKDVRRQLRLEEIQALGMWVPFDEYPKHYQMLDAAIVPLQLNAFNQAKSWLKGIEAAALGVPFVASPTKPYRELHDLGAGLLAHDPGDWRRHLARLMTDRSYSRAIAENGRAVAAEWTYERRAWRWMEAWTQARANFEGRMVA